MAHRLLLGLVAVGLVMTIGFLLAGGGGVSQAGHDTTHGDLLLDAATCDNTRTEVIDGGLDISGPSSVPDLTIGTDDDCDVALDIEVIDGKLDISGNGSIGTEDDGSFASIEVIDGGLDIMDNGSIDSDDDGFVFDLIVGTIERQLCNVEVGSPVTIDVVAVNAEDWAALAFVIYYPSPAVVTAPGPDDSGEGGPFDFVPPSFNPSPPPTFLGLGPNNFLFPDASDAGADYKETALVPDGSSGHGVLMFDTNAFGPTPTTNSGSGGLVHISLDTTNLSVGEHTLILGNSRIFESGLHSDIDATPFLPDNYGAFKLAIGRDCSTDSDGDGVSDADENACGSDPDDVNSIPESDDWLPEFFTQEQNPGGPTTSDGIDNDRDGRIDETDSVCVFELPQTPPATATVPSGVLGGEQPTSTPTPTATALPDLPETGGPPPSGPSGSSWLIVVYVAGGVVATMAAVGAISQRLKRRAARVK